MLIKMYIFLVIFILGYNYVCGLREHRSWSTRHPCLMSIEPNWPFAYEKYISDDLTMAIELTGRVNTNLQDFRHECQVRGGQSKCHICEEIDCSAESGKCQLQLQGVNTTQMSRNIPVVSDSAWAVGGSHRRDYGNASVTHFCVFLSGESCLNPATTDYSGCKVRCFGYGFPEPARPVQVIERSIIDQYDGQPRWDDDGLVDMWHYPLNCSEANDYGLDCTVDSTNDKTPSFNPQGFTFTLSGSGEQGFDDGPAETATFFHPEGIVVDEMDLVYVADTDNNAIRMIQPNGTVTTITGLGPDNAGFEDGACDIATFSKPKGLDVRYAEIDGVMTKIIVVADTGNHRIRQIEIVESPYSCNVACLTGICGNDTTSFTDNKYRATPYAGFADGTGLEARFSAPEGITFLDDGDMVVADSGNWLLRYVTPNGTTFTLAGEIANGPSDDQGRPVGGCPPPCLIGVPGFRDGNLTFAQFYNPVDVARGPNNTIYVADEHRIRIVELPHRVSEIYTVQSEGRVSTLAGNSFQGTDDGASDDSTFFDPTGIIVTNDNIAYVVDTASCKVRRISPIELTATPLTCEDTGIDLLRPSGCMSYDTPIDDIGRKISHAEGHFLYNNGDPNAHDVHKDHGKYIKNCVGVPPPDVLDKHTLFPAGDNLVIDDKRYLVNQDSEEGGIAIVRCPGGCASETAHMIQGNHWYSDDSSVCRAAIHDGIISDETGGFIRVTFQRKYYIDGTGNMYNSSTTRNNITSEDMSLYEERIFSIEPTVITVSYVHTISGHPTGHLDDGCGKRDSQPPQGAYFDKPQGIAANLRTVISDTTFLYIADSGNHQIRGMSAVCTQICENGGKCVFMDTCQCAAGWTGIDCTTPVCSTPCGANMVCTSPDTCTCKPGYEGTNCDIPQCIQDCQNGGKCTAPDTCTCAFGWFDTNCTTPVCTNTCANGGNCTAPDECACPSDWTSHDCRVPVCEQTCHNGGYCVAPNTCICPPQWINFDCSVPVCTQGYFKPNPTEFPNHLYSTGLRHWPMYRPCNIDVWCNATDEFECFQEDLERLVIELPSGGSNRAITGRKDRPTRCMQIEVRQTFKLPFVLLNSDNASTPMRRYAPKTPYLNNVLNPWRGYENFTEGHTGPWTYEADRQIAEVQWLNVSQGVYACANGGNCTSPGICECAPGWMGFDCRTPICEQGYFFPEQDSYVSGLETEDELTYFQPFIGNNSYQLSWPYSNPNYTMQWEFYINSDETEREIRDHGGVQYLGPADWSTKARVPTDQGGYRCSIRAMTDWENREYVMSHPNYFSQYMNPKVELDGVQYTHWVGMEWPPVHRKSRILVDTIKNVTYMYTNEGYRIYGIWNRTYNDWTYGTCIVEFDRNCSDISKDFDLQSNLEDVPVQDTDLAYRPRITYNDARVNALGRWVTAGGECTNNVLRGCFNNGTCVAPNTCQCATGWSGYDCRVPICDFECLHNGNCTTPGVCTCERGWEGFDCSIPICAQECQNGGVCVAPDTCKCLQWPNEYRDGRSGGGRPLYRKPNGDPQDTGWTGFDCSVPICVQNEKFLHVKDPSNASAYLSLGGHGGDNLLECVEDGKILPRCPVFDVAVTTNEGTSFQTGCGFDMLYTGCCYSYPDNYYECHKCDAAAERITENTYFCTQEPTLTSGLGSEISKFADFLDEDNNFRLCGKYHSPRADGSPQYVTVKDPLYSSYNYMSNLTSDLFLCNVKEWIQGDYTDDAGLGDIEGVGTIFGLKSGRHVRINYPNMIGEAGEEGWVLGEELPGEGIYACYNRGSCLAPDLCSCTDGYEGYDCRTPLCRHLQPSDAVTSCLNGGVCASRDDCDCIQTDSVLWMAHTEAARGVTGWTGSDCSIPMCVQGYYDPFCTDLPQAPAGEGCYRCANFGNCTAPEVCTCAEGWTGYDCRTPVCEVVADPLTRTQLPTIFEDKIISFETDPCAGSAIYPDLGWDNRAYVRGNCTQPNECTCLCKSEYDVTICDAEDKQCDGAWQDNMWKWRDVLSRLGPEYVFGTTDCIDGFEGNLNDLDKFVTCHQTIYVPTQTERDSLVLIISLSIVAAVLACFWFFIRRKLKKRYLLAKIERRRSRRSSEESLLKANKTAFSNK